MNAKAKKDSENSPDIAIPRPTKKPDIATIFGFVATMLLIVAAIKFSDSSANFFNVPAVLIVFLGTITATTISFSMDELLRAGHLFGQSFSRKVWNASKLSYSLIDLAVVAKKQGVLALSKYERKLNQDVFMGKSIQMAVDGYLPDNIDRLLENEIEALADRHKRSASIAKRAAEVAPAMGLIGTLVGLVQMLADLENPESLGPAMAVAILTTLYGAVLGMVFMAALAEKLEKNSEDETLIKTLIKITAVSIARQDNPRQLEMQLNAELPPAKRIVYFD